MKMCQCEHAKHFEGTEVRKEFPHVHLYGDVLLPVAANPARIPGIAVFVDVKTNYGTFTVCESCAETCLKP